MADKKTQKPYWEIVKAVCTIALVIVICVKIYTTPTSLTVDFPTLLSLLLALFSVALSALFYFKATDTSNTFYDNTYKFTGDIAQLLAKMESGFGERLRHLDEGYASMRGYLQDGARANGDVEKTKQILEVEKQEVHKVIEERNKIVRDLIERSNLQKEEKERIATQLKEKEVELTNMQREVAKLNRRQIMERVRRQTAPTIAIPSNDGMDRFTQSQVIDKIGRNKILTLSEISIRRYFDQIYKELPQRYIDDLIRNEYYDDSLTALGVSYLRSLARNAE